jgi:hypothetical protein
MAMEGENENDTFFFKFKGQERHLSASQTVCDVKAELSAMRSQMMSSRWVRAVYGCGAEPYKMWKIDPAAPFTAAVG